MLVIDGKYNSEDGMNIRSSLGRRYRESSIRSEEIVQRMVGMLYRQYALVNDAGL